MLLCNKATKPDLEIISLKKWKFNILTNGIQEKEDEVENVKDGESYEKLVECVSQLFSWQNEDGNQIGGDPNNCQTKLPALQIKFVVIDYSKYNEHIKGCINWSFK